MKKLRLILISATALTIMSTTAQAYSTPPIGGTKKIITPADTSNWVFSASTVLPQFGTSRQVNGNNYTVTYSKNKLSVYLPYFGRAYAGADVFSDKGPLDFVSSNFTMEKHPAKKGGWIITIKPKDYSEVQSMTLTFYDNGNATLDVSMLSRSAISYYGSVEAAK